MLPFQLDSPLCVGNAGEKFREGSGYAKLTHPCVGHAGVKFGEGSGLAKLTHPFVGHARYNLEKDVALRN